MLKLPKPTKHDVVEARRLQEQLESAMSRIEETDDPDEQATLIRRTEALDRELSISRSRHLLLRARNQGIEVKPVWISTYSDSEWLTSEGRESIENALRRRRTEDWLKLIPIIVSSVAIMVSIASAIVTSRFSQQKDFLLNRSWLSGSELISPLRNEDQTHVLSLKGIALRITNNGRAPALHAIVVGYAIVADSDQFNLGSDIAKACSKASQVSSNGDFVPPGSSLTIPFDAPIPTAPQASSSGDSSSPVLVAGCIGYDDSLDRKRHVTSFGFRSAQKLIGAVRSGAMPSKTNVPEEHDGEMRLVWTPFSLGYGMAY
ncbi:hypothetical protein [Tunturiibacter psychrotolerans]|uniref:hypothetical protein n=1 Tax=Tunturiibacter psychrotolerans TaxID=3069686 RepID=UPI003D1AC0AF